MFGPYQKVILHLIELPFAEKMLNGLIMELQDSAYRCVAGLVPSLDVNEGFKDIDVAILVGARPRGPGMERKDLLEANAEIFKV
jgi:malate dehydrogenase